MEDSQDFVAPELDQVVLSVLVSLLCVVETLEDLRDVAHVEHVVGVSRRGQELLLNLVKELDSCDCERLTQGFDLFREVVELEGGEGLENALQVSLVGHDVVDNVELGEHARSNLGSAAAGWSHGCNYLQVAHVVLHDLLAIEPVAVVDPLTEQLDGWLGAELFLLGHVQVVNKRDGLEL